MLKQAASISPERDNILLAKFLGQLHVYFGMDQKLRGKNTTQQIIILGEKKIIANYHTSGKWLGTKKIFQISKTLFLQMK